MVFVVPGQIWKLCRKKQALEISSASRFFSPSPFLSLPLFYYINSSSTKNVDPLPIPADSAQIVPSCDSTILRAI